MRPVVFPSRRVRAVARRLTASAAGTFVGLSRHGVVAAERFATGPVPRTGARYVLSQTAGSILIGVGVALFVHAELGVPAYDVMLTAMRDQLGITLGQASWLLTGSLFAVATLLGRPPGPSGLVFMVANGLAVDTALALVRSPEPLVLRMGFVAGGTLTIAAGVALIVHAGLTGGAIELLMKAANDRGLDPYRARYGLEIAIVALGVALGGDLGPATLFFVLTMSPTLKLGQQALRDHQTGRASRLTAAPTPIETS
ncbi:MAG: hypothetical protein AAGD35_15315 [Actinomycetota bacterium]